MTPINELVDYYKTHSLAETAKHFHHYTETALIAASVHIRTIGEAISRGHHATFPQAFTRTQQEVLVGSMLGDGSLTKLYRGTHALFMERHCEKQLEYLEWKASVLGAFSRPLVREEQSSKSLRDLGLKPKQDFYVSYKPETVRHALFSKMEREWYARDSYLIRNKRRVKILPNELCLTSLTLAIWFGDDGRNLSRRRVAFLSTDGFTKAECERLCTLLKQFANVSSYLALTNNRQYEIGIASRSYLDFIAIVREYLPSACISEYVAPRKRGYKARPIPEEVPAYFRSHTYPQIAEHFDISGGTALVWARKLGLWKMKGPVNAA